MAAPTFVATTNTTYASRTNTTVTKPTGTVNGDLVILFFLNARASSYGPAPTAPAGFTALPGTPMQVNNSGFFVASRVYYKIASSEGASWAFTHAAITTQAFAVAYRGVDTITPLDATATLNTGNGTVATWTGLTTATADAMLVALGHDWGDATNNLAPPTGFTERLEVNPLVYASDKVQTGTGATGNFTHTVNNLSALPWTAALMALRPVSGSSPETVTPTGIATGAAVGSPVISTAITVSPSGIATGAATGTPAVSATITVSPTGIATGAAVGTPALSGTVTVSPSGIASGAALGTPAVTSAITVTPTGVASGAAVGTPAVTANVTVSPTGISTGEVVGTPSVVGDSTVTPTGITSGAQVGTPAVTTTITVSPSGITSASDVGTPTITASSGPDLDRNLPYTLTVTGAALTVEITTPSRDLTVDVPETTIAELTVTMVTPTLDLTITAPPARTLEVDAPARTLELEP